MAKRMIKTVNFIPNDRNGLTPIEVEVDAENLEALQSMVGGLIERIPFGTYEFWVNEEGYNLDLPIRMFLGVRIAGPFFVTRRDMGSLDEADLLMFQM